MKKTGKIILGFIQKGVITNPTPKPDPTFLRLVTILKYCEMINYHANNCDKLFICLFFCLFYMPSSSVITHMHFFNSHFH